MTSETDRAETHEDKPIMVLLSMIQAHGGRMDTSGDDSLDQFCDDRGSGPDTFNLARERGLTRVTHDDRFDTSTVYLTDAGRALIQGAQP